MLKIELEFNQSAWSSEDKSIEIGNATNANIVLTIIPELKITENFLFTKAEVMLRLEFTDMNTMISKTVTYPDFSRKKGTIMFAKKNISKLISNL